MSSSIMVYNRSARERAAKVIKDSAIWDIINRAARGELTYSSAVDEMRKHYGVELPPHPGLDLRVSDGSWEKKVDESPLGAAEYLRRVSIINEAEQLMFTEGVHERYAESGVVRLL